MVTAEEVKINFVPSSSANVGLYYDVACLGLTSPYLKVTLARSQKSGVELDVKSSLTPPSGRILGYAGKTALEEFYRERGITDGAHLLYEDGDDAYPVGGLGRSGAEAVGAIMAAAVMYDIPLSRSDVVVSSARGEPGEHKDNVAASTNGRMNFIAQSPATNQYFVDSYDVPPNLGIVMGYSSHEKTMGTAGGRRVLRYPVLAEDFVTQTGMIAVATAALVDGNTDRFLEMVWGDKFNERRRADIGFYGNFDADPLFGLKKQLFENHGVAWVVSGAGGNMIGLYNKDRYPDGIIPAISPIVVPWNQERGIVMRLVDKEIAKGGAYDYAQQAYNY